MLYLVFNIGLTDDVGAFIGVVTVLNDFVIIMLN